MFKVAQCGKGGNIPVMRRSGFPNLLLRNLCARVYEYINPGYVSKRLDEHASGLKTTVYSSGHCSALSGG
jgi:hypothetical protein